MSIFKPRMMSYKQIAAVKWGTLAFGLLAAHYWPVITEWTTFWWIVLVVSVAYVFTFWFKK